MRIQPPELTGQQAALVAKRAEMLTFALTQIGRFDYRDKSFLQSNAHTVQGLAGRPPQNWQLLYLSEREAAYLFVLARKAQDFIDKDAHERPTPQVQSRFAMMRP